MREVTVYVVAESKEEAELFAAPGESLRKPPFGRFGMNTFVTKGAARLYCANLRGSNPGREFEVYPVYLIATSGEPLSRARRKVSR